MILDQISLFDAEWCQRWADGMPVWRPTSEGAFNPRHYRVRPIPEKAARGFVTREHYSHSYPAGRAQYGLFEGGHLVGVAVIGVPMHPKVTANQFPKLGKAAAELSRFVLLDPVPALGESWFLGRMFRLAAADGLLGLVAFSDPMPRLTADGQLLMPGHVGTIYQATNARYTGRGTARTLRILPDNTVFTDRTARKILGCERGDEHVFARLVALGAEPFSPYRPPAAWLSDARPSERGVLWLALTSKAQRKAWLDGALDTVGARRVRHKGNHRFVWAIGDRGQRRRCEIAFDPRPYPKTVDAAPDAWGLAA